MALATIPTHRVETGRRLREISNAQVEVLVQSIADVGLLNPITVYERKVIEAGISVDGYGLVAGAHRLEAVRRLGLAEIDALIVNLGELERQIAECDENLCASSLTKSERATFTIRRKEAYEALHGPAKAVGGYASAKAQGKNVATANLADATFTTDTAAKTGQSERAVRRDAERGEKITTAALAMIRGTPLDTGTYLDALKKVPLEEQTKQVKADLEAKKPPKPKKTAPPPESDEDVHERQLAALMSAWNKAGPDVRKEFLAEVTA